MFHPERTPARWSGERHRWAVPTLHLLDTRIAATMELQLEESVAVVVGGASGIGRAIALKFAQNGVHVVVNYVRHRRDAEETVAAIEEHGVGCLAIKANVAKAREDLRQVELLELVHRIEVGRGGERGDRARCGRNGRPRPGDRPPAGQVRPS